MSTFSKQVLSGSTDGRGIKVAATTIASGTTIHTAQASGVTPDLVTLFAMNSDTVTRTLTLGWGGSTNPDDLITISLPAQSGLVLVVASLPVRNSLAVVAAADAANKIVLFGYVDRIT